MANENGLMKNLMKEIIGGIRFWRLEFFTPKTWGLTTTQIMARILARALLGFTAGFLVAGTATAGVILQPTAITANTLGTVVGDQLHLIDQSGIPAYTSGVTDYDSFVAGNPTHVNQSPLNAWQSFPTIITGDIDFDLGGTFTLTNFALWSGFGFGWAVNSFTLLVDDNAAFSSPINVGTFSNPNLLQPVPVQSFGFSPTTGSLVRMRINSNHGQTSGTIVAEVAFGTASVPEPTTLLLLGLGLAGLGFARKRLH